MSSDLADLVEVQFTLTPGTVITHRYRQTGAEEYADTPVTLGEFVAEAIAEKLATQIKAELRDVYEYRSAAEAAVTEFAERRVRESLAKYTQPTDAFGTPKGEAKSIAELIDDKITAWFNVRSDSYRSETNLQKLIADAVDRQLKADIGKAVKDAKAKVLAALTEEAQAQLATALAEVVAKAVRV